MSNATYYLAWLAAGLVLTAIASAAITRHLRLRAERRVMAAELLDALARYSGWVAAQRRIALFEGETQDGDLPLRKVCAIQQKWFAELSPETAQLLGVHAGLVEFLRAQHALRLNDAEAWLESDPDALFMEFWRSHRHAVQAIGENAKQVVGVAGDGMDAGSTFPA